MAKSNIGWCDYVWNPIAGCAHAGSPGCDNCYAERMALRLKRMGQRDYQQVVDDFGWTGRVNCLPHRIEQPLHWRKPRRIFVCSMSDLFHPDVPFAFIAQVFEIMAHPRASQHTFILLTKRADRMLHFYNWLRARFEAGGFWSGDSPLGLALEIEWPLPNVWVMVTVENNESLWRIGELLRIPAVVRGVCLEPMQESISLRQHIFHPTGQDLVDDPGYHWPGSLDWVIIGAESGPNRRPFEKAWAWDMLDHCREEGVPCFLKQGSGARPGVPLLDRNGKVVKEWPCT